MKPKLNLPIGTPGNRAAIVRPRDAHFERVRNEVEAEFAHLRNTRGQFVILALNEAELVAWQTPYPHLVFPVLAQEKVRAVAAWHERQDRLLRRDAMQAFGA